jgi:predicted secreted protein
MSIRRGTDLMVFVTKGAGLKSVAYATNHTLTVGTNTTEISTKDNPEGGSWVEQQVQKLNWSLSTENLYSNDGQGNSFEDLFDIMITKKPVFVKFALESEYANPPENVPVGGWVAIDPSSTTPVYSGYAFITDLSLNAPDGDNASFSCTLTGNGKFKKDITPPED